MGNLREFLTSNQTKTFYWTTVNAAIALVVTYLAGFETECAVFGIAFLNALTKKINKKYL